MKLAREFSRPDWRAMLAGISSTELSEWVDFFDEHFFSDVQLDAHFASFEHLTLSMTYPKHNRTMTDFMLLKSAKNSQPDNSTEMSDDEMMVAAEGIPGGVRYGP
ncbi:phage tail assembly protein T [Budviciaceae bacterium CWB-B4]|uniref:Phage tail assembly protein T n=1 Tax=Limnobaculum xujianqingii TaxID=2738837 RepID=A0A9D7AGJ1_9GAMM|nr:phage tail assembly protein T [Limnobaculum xujianqingii]MBK5072233.1 phage tail assembly protein T [Limnobaculum xujianqingii]MBK5175542.1 phage tail assembly protein T [Limnobaculum xujianqingii]